MSDYLENQEMVSYSQESELPVQEVQEVEENLPVMAVDIEEKTTAYYKIVQRLIYVVVFMLPLFFLPWTTSILELNKEVLLIIVSGVGLIFWLLHVVISGQLPWRSTVLEKGVIALLGANLVVTIFSVAKFKSLFGFSDGVSNSLVVALSLVLMYFLIVNVFNDGGKKLKLLLSLSVGIALLYALLQMLHVYIFKFLLITNSRAFNSIGSLNSVGILAAITLPMFLKNKSSNRITSYLNVLWTFVALAILVIINWWILWLVAIAGMVAVITLDSIAVLGGSSMNSHTESSFRISKFIFPMSVIVVAVFLMVVNFNLNFIKKNLPVEIAPSFNLSMQTINSVVKESPVYGYGLENFSLAFDKYGAKSLANTTLSNIKLFDATSQLFNFIVNGGLLMLTAIIFLLWSLFKGFWKNRRHLYQEIGVVSGLVSILVATLIYPFNLTNMFMMYMFFALVSLFWSGNGKKLFNIEEKASTSLVSSLGFIGGLILVLVGVYFGGTLYLADVKYAKALNEADNQKAASILVEAINLNGHDDRYYRSASQVVVGLLASEINKKGNDPDRNSRIQNYLTSAINLAKKATELSPRESANWTNLGSVYQSLVGLIDGVDKLAEDSYLKSLELRPGDPNVYNRIGTMYLGEADLLRQLVNAGGANAGRLNETIASTLLRAEVNFQKAIGLSNNYGLAIYNLGAVYDREGKLNEAIKQLEKLAPFNPNQPTLAFELGLLYYRAGNKDKSFQQMQRAVFLSPNFSNARWYLALIYEERKDLIAAIDQLQKILSIDVNKDNQTVLNKLADLKKGKTSIPPEKVTDQKPL